MMHILNENKSKDSGYCIIIAPAFSLLDSWLHERIAYVQMKEKLPSGGFSCQKCNHFILKYSGSTIIDRIKKCQAWILWVALTSVEIWLISKVKLWIGLTWFIANRGADWKVLKWEVFWMAKNQCMKLSGAVSCKLLIECECDAAVVELMRENGCKRYVMVVLLKRILRSNRFSLTDTPIVH